MKIDMMSIDAIKEYERNPRHNDPAVDAVAGSIREFGFKVPIIIDHDNIIVSGHTRIRGARKLGLTEVPVVRADDLTPEQIKAFRIADNKLHELSSWNVEMLAMELDELKVLDVDLNSLGFDDDEIERLLGRGVTEGLCDPEEVPAPPDEATTQPGDLWVLGVHRLLCGDSSSADDVDRLLDGQPVHLVNTDPPYNVKVEPRSKNAIAAGLSSFSGPGLTHHQSFDKHRADKRRSKPKNGKAKRSGSHKKMRAKDRPLENDFVSEEAFNQMLRAWFGNIARVLLPGRAAYIWGGYANCANYPSVLKEVGLYFSQAIIWDKQHPVLTRKDYMGAHEWCQPPDTKVLTPQGTSRLSELRDGDRVVSFYKHNSSVIGIRDGLEVRVTQRQYDGTLYGVTVGDKQSWCSDGHLWTIRLTVDYPRKWCVYLMRRGTWWRVGVTQMRTTWGLGLKGRLCSECGNEGWILSLHDSRADARMQEQLVSIRFGIPQTCWKERPKAHRRQRSHIEELYANLDPAEQDRAADAVLRAHHRSRKYPFVQNDDTRAKFGARQSTQVRACNLLPEIMEVPIPIGGQKVQWQVIRAIDVQPYSGPVHSMGVSQYQHYIADGIVTHNCFYTWKEGAAHKFFGPNNVPDLWHVKKINPQSMVHLTEKPVELARRALQYSSRAGENVLDLFGGSGSTLIAAQQTERKAYLMEIDPLYCDVIVDRFERFSGKKAERIACGRGLEENAEVIETKAKS